MNSKMHPIDSTGRHSGEMENPSKGVSEFGFELLDLKERN